MPTPTKHNWIYKLVGDDQDLDYCAKCGIHWSSEIDKADCKAAPTNLRKERGDL